MPRIEIVKPKEVIGRNTINSIQAGIFYGYVGLVDGIVRRIQDECGVRAQVVATGGLAPLVAAECSSIGAVDEFLTLGRFAHPTREKFSPGSESESSNLAISNKEEPIDMAAAELEKLRNVGILGQGGSGKTSLGEAMLFGAGATQRLGKVLDGTSVLDHEPEEIKHHISISTAFHSLSWKKFPMTVLDTPGYAAFLADTINSMRAFGGAVFVLNPSVGLRVEAEQLWAQANEDKVSRLLFVNKMDHEQAEVEQRIAPMLETLEAKGGLSSDPHRS